MSVGRGRKSKPITIETFIRKRSLPQNECVLYPYCPPPQNPGSKVKPFRPIEISFIGDRIKFSLEKLGVINAPFSTLRLDLKETKIAGFGKKYHRHRAEYSGFWGTQKLNHLYDLYSCELLEK
jgi:hypothetical protein